MVVSLLILASVTAANPPSKAAVANSTNSTNSSLDTVGLSLHQSPPNTF